MNIEDLTIKQLRDIVTAFDPNLRKSHSFEVGKSYLIRTVTMTQVGRVVAVTDSDILLENAAWVADTGRFSNALKAGELLEVEPFPDGCGVSREAIVDFAPWKHDLPREVK